MHGHIYFLQNPVLKTKSKQQRPDVEFVRELTPVSFSASNKRDRLEIDFCRTWIPQFVLAPSGYRPLGVVRQGMAFGILAIDTSGRYVRINGDCSEILPPRMIDRVIQIYTRRNPKLEEWLASAKSRPKRKHATLIEEIPTYELNVSPKEDAPLATTVVVWKRRRIGLVNEGIPEICKSSGSNTNERIVGTARFPHLTLSKIGERYGSNTRHPNSESANSLAAS